MKPDVCMCCSSRVGSTVWEKAVHQGWFRPMLNAPGAVSSTAVSVQRRAWTGYSCPALSSLTLAIEASSRQSLPQLQGRDVTDKSMHAITVTCDRVTRGAHVGDRR